MASYPQVSPTKSSIRLSSPPYALHAPPISLFSIWSAEQYWLRSYRSQVPPYVVFSTPLSSRSSYAQIFSSTPYSKNPPPAFLRQCERPSFTHVYKSNTGRNSNIFSDRQSADEFQSGLGLPSVPGETGGMYTVKLIWAPGHVGNWRKWNVWWISQTRLLTSACSTWACTWPIYKSRQDVIGGWTSRKREAYWQSVIWGQKTD